MHWAEVSRALLTIAVAMASSEAKAIPKAIESAKANVEEPLTAEENQEADVSATPESRRNIRRQLAASAGTKGGSSAGGTKRKSRGSLDVPGTY